MNAYPACNFARGITRPECIIKNKIRACVFDFDKYVRPGMKREMSIVWLIDQSSIEYAKRQKNRKGESQFKLGFAVVNKSVLDDLIRGSNGRLSHRIDRSPHGLIVSDLEKIELKRISQHLAECSKYYSYVNKIPIDVC